MAARTYIFAALAALTAALLWRQLATPEPLAPFVQGRNSTVLFAVNGHPGMSNAHLATAQALLENHPDIEIHFVSFPVLHKRMPRVEAAAHKRQHLAKNMTFHPLTGPGYIEAINGHLDEWNENGTNAALAPAGPAGFSVMLEIFEYAMDPWTAEEHYDSYKRIVQVIDQVDPAVVVLDWYFQPGIEAVHDTNRQAAFVVPNHAADILAGHQPWGAFFWRYPVVSSGYSFPVPWRLIPSNVLMGVRLIYALVTGPVLAEKRAALRTMGVQDPINVASAPRADVPVIVSDTPDMSVPLDHMPANVIAAGPIVLSTSSAADQDSRLFAWIQQKPTLLINLGTGFVSPPWQVDYFVKAIDDLMARSDDLQILWKLHSWKPREFATDRWGDRVRVMSWLPVDPASLLETGHIVATVNHGAAGALNDGLTTGTPHVVLPMWADCYGIARRVHDIGLGVYACQQEAPWFSPECISEGIWQVAIGPKRHSYLAKAKEIQTGIKKMGQGRDIAANEIARLARLN